MQKLDGISDLPWFSYGYQKHMFVNFLFEYKGPPNCVNFWI